jgi:hypothetical protein
MYDIYIVYDDPSHRQLVDMISFRRETFIHWFDMNTSEGRKKGFKLKGQFGAKKNPFVLVEKNDELIKVFWSEGKDDAINQFIKWATESEG